MERKQDGSSKADRKTIEKNRRNQMKSLYSELNSLIPSHKSKDTMSVPDQLDEAINYIKKLEKQLEQMKEKKKYLMGIDHGKGMKRRTMGGKPVQVEVNSAGSALEVVLVSGINDQSMFFEIIRVLQNEGANVINASFSIVGENIFHTIHAEVGESSLGSLGFEAARIISTLRKYVHDYTNCTPNF